MKIFIIIFIIFTNLYSTDLSIHISPDTIYVGTLTTLIVSINDLKEDEYPEFLHMNENHNKYSISDRILSNNSVNYRLQFWEVGNIYLEPIVVIIKKNKKTIFRLQSDIIDIQVLSNINQNQPNHHL